MFIGRVCERFDVLPSQAVAEWEQHGWFLEHVMEALHCADTKSAIDRAQTDDQMPDGEMAGLIIECIADQVKEARQDG